MLLVQLSHQRQTHWQSYDNSSLVHSGPWSRWKSPWDARWEPLGCPSRCGPRSFGCVSKWLLKYLHSWQPHLQVQTPLAGVKTACTSSQRSCWLEQTPSLFTSCLGLIPELGSFSAIARPRPKAPCYYCDQVLYTLTLHSHLAPILSIFFFCIKSPLALNALTLLYNSLALSSSA